VISLSQDQSQQMRRRVLITGLMATFAFWFPLDDPMNLPKLFVVLTLSAWIFGSLAVAIFYDRSRKFEPAQWALLAVVLSMIVAAILTDVRYTAFFGGTHRNNGAFTYIALAVISFAAMICFDFKSLNQLRTSLLIVGILSTIYGLLQTTGHDPFRWTHLYSPVVGTVGNPDFFSALVGVAAIATVWFLLVKNEMKYRVGAGVLLLLELFVVKRSGSLQGLVAFAIGTSIVVLVRIWQYQRRLGVIATIGVFIGGVLVFLGVVNHGPLATFVYRASLTNRVDYWRAALSMFKSHPFFGLGLERFAENYPQYAPQVQVVQGVNTDNAHNVFLQLLATGGLLVIIPYLFLLALIFWTALKAIKSSSAREQIEIAALFSIWIALLLVSLISIDNLGVTIWFWISGGALYAITHSREPEMVLSNKSKKGKGKSARQPKQDNSSYIAPIASLVLVIATLTLMVPIIRTSGSIYRLSGNGDGLTKEQYVTRLNDVANGFPKNSQTLTSLADLSLRISDPDQALRFTKVVLEEDQKSFLGNLLTASAYEMSEKYELAIPYRLRVIGMDPWNAKNMLEIVRDYLALQDVTKAKVMAERIAQLAPGSGEDLAAAALIKG